MRLTKFGHSCVLVEEGPDRILVDPGTFSDGFEGLTGLTAVLVTHQHPDHADPARLPALLAANPAAQLFADPGSAQTLSEAGLTATPVNAGDRLDLATEVEVFGDTHAVIHRDVPTIPNRGYLFAGRLYLPGDSLQVPTVPVEILGLPVSAPWMAVKEAVDFLRAVDPTTVFPIHEKVLATTKTVYGLLEKLKPADTGWLDLDDGTPVEL